MRLPLNLHRNGALRIRLGPTSGRPPCRHRQFRSRCSKETATPADPAPPTGPVPDYEHPWSPEEARQRGYEVVDWIVEYFDRVHTLPVRSQVEPGYLAQELPDAAPEQGESFQEVMDDVERVIMPGVTHWQSPRFMAFYPANVSWPALCADMLSGAFNAIGFSWIASPAETELEMLMMDWLGKLCSLPEGFLSSSGTGGGVIQGTASEAVVVAMLAARSRTMQGRPHEDSSRLVAYTSDQAHSCVEKACMIAGVQHFRLLPATAVTEYSLEPEVLRAAIEADEAAGLLPFFVTANVGTTSSAAVDPVRLIGEVTAPRRIWLHVDAAYAGSASICPEFAPDFDGLELAESFDFNPHKWLLTNFDCSAMWVQDSTHLKAALSITPEILRAKGNVLDYKDWQIPLGRRFRSLKMFFVMRCYGAEALRAHIRHHVALASYFAAVVEADDRFQLAVRPRFGLVCFWVVGADNDASAAILEAINAAGVVMMSHTKLEGRHTLRMALGGALTQQRHVDEAWREVCTHRDALMGSTPAVAPV